MNYEKAIKEIMRHVDKPGTDDQLIHELTHMHPKEAAVLLHAIVEGQGDHSAYILVKTAFLAGAILARAAEIQ